MASRDTSTPADAIVVERAPLPAGGVDVEEPAPGAALAVAPDTADVVIPDAAGALVLDPGVAAALPPLALVC